MPNDIPRHRTTPDDAPVLSTAEARQAVTTGRVRYVLAASVVLAVIAMVITFVAV
jgi:hypothetical protein